MSNLKGLVSIMSELKGAWRIGAVSKERFVERSAICRKT
jgi:hypothetical protein